MCYNSKRVYLLYNKYIFYLKVMAIFRSSVSCRQHTHFQSKESWVRSYVRVNPFHNVQPDSQWSPPKSVRFLTSTAGEVKGGLCVLFATLPYLYTKRLKVMCNLGREVQVPRSNSDSKHQREASDEGRARQMEIALRLCQNTYRSQSLILPGQIKTIVG